MATSNYSFLTGTYILFADMALLCSLNFLLVGVTLALVYGLIPRRMVTTGFARRTNGLEAKQAANYGQTLSERSNHVVKDILGLGAPEIAICLVAALVLFGPETLKSLSKDVGKAAAELKEIPKTFKEGMDEGAEAVQLSKMKAIAAEKRRKRDEKLERQAAKSADDVDAPAV
jgi:Sec-independent protein translocase protein TatA